MVGDSCPCTFIQFWAKLPHQLGDIFDTRDLKPLDSIPEEGMLAVRLYDGSINEGQLCHIKPSGDSELMIVSKDVEEKWAKYKESWAAYPMNSLKKWDFKGKFGDFDESGDFNIALIRGNDQYLIRIPEVKTGIYFPQIINNEFKSRGFWGRNTNVKIKKATEQESKHMQSCIDAGEYVPPTFYGKTKDFNDGYYHIKGEFEYMAKFIDGMSQGYIDISFQSTYYSSKFEIEDFIYKSESEIRPCTPEEIKIIDLSMENGEYTEQLDPTNLIVGEIYTCKCSNDGRFVYKFTEESERIPFYCVGKGVPNYDAPSSDFQDDGYSGYALASEEQKQKFYELFPETPDKPEIEGYEVIEFRKVKIGEQYTRNGSIVYECNVVPDGPRWVIKPIKEDTIEDTYWQDLYGECFSHAIKVEGDKDQWAKLCREYAI